MSSHIKNFTCVIILICGFISMAQERQSRIFDDPEDSIRVTNMQNYRPRLLAFSFDLQQSIPSGNKFIGKAMTGKMGFDINAQIYVYKQFFLKLGFGANYFEVEDKSVVGNYEKSTFSNQSLSIGYEFLPFDKVRLGVSFCVIGNSDYRNRIIDGSRGLQRDNAKLNAYGFYLDYELNYFTALYLKYDYRNDKTNIQVPDELTSTFDRAQFHSVGIGFKIYIDDSNLFH